MDCIIFRHSRTTTISRVSKLSKITPLLQLQLFIMSNLHSSIEVQSKHRTRIFRSSTANVEDFLPSKKSSAVEKHFRATSDDTIRLKSQSIIINRRRKANCSEHIKQRTINKHQTFASTQYQSSYQNRCSQIQKNINKKGRLEIKHIQQWLNTLLIEYCYEERFDKTVRLCALKKFQIDRNSLLSKSLSHSQIDRLYRSLLVYSVGFNKLLKQLSKTSEVTKAIWRVYSLLIQYCAEGNFQSMVAEIEREKVLQLNQLQQQLEQKDKQLQDINQAEKVNRAKAYKELKHLKQEHIQLKNQKAIIEQDFKQADQAFNEEVNLRLKFQHKINQVNGVHRQLGNKHLLLFQDFQQYKTEYQKLFEQSQEIMKKNSQLQIKLYKEEDIRKEAQAKGRANQDIIKGLQNDMNHEIRKIKEQEKTRRNEYLSRKQLEISHLTHQITSLNSTLSLREQALKMRIHEINILVVENENLHRLNQQQKTRITQLEIKQNSYQSRTVDLKTHSQLLQETLNSQIEETNTIKSQLDCLKATLLQTNIDLKSSCEVVTLMKLNGKEIDVNLVEMKSANSKLEIQLKQLKSKAASLDQLASNRQSLYGKAKIQLRQQVQKCNELEFKFKQLETAFKLQKKSNQKTISSLKSAISQLKSQNFSLQSKNVQLQKTIDRIQVQNYELRLNDQRIKSNLRDQKFQRKQIDLQFKQSLLLVSDEKNLVKELTIEATRAQQQAQKAMAKLKSAQFLFQQKQNNLNAKLLNLQSSLLKAKQTISSKIHHIHPMRYEDVRSQLIHFIQKYNTINYLHEELIKSLGPKEEEINKKLKRLRREYQFTQNQYKAEMDRKLFAKVKQLQSMSKAYDLLTIEQNDLKNNLKNKSDYLEIIEQKLNLSLLQNKKSQTEVDTLKQRNSQLNRKTFELENKVSFISCKLQSQQKKLKRVIEQQRAEFDAKFLKIQNQCKEKQKEIQKARQNSINSQKFLQNNIIDLANPLQNTQVKNKLTYDGNSELPNINKNPNNIQRQSQQATQKKSNLFNSSTYKSRFSNQNVMNKTSELPGSVKEEEHNLCKSAQKEITRKIKNAVSYYTKSTNK